MNSTKLRDAELGGMREVMARELEASKQTARRAYEGGEMTVRDIASLVGADVQAVKRWVREGGWRRE